MTQCVQQKQFAKAQMEVVLGLLENVLFYTVKPVPPKDRRPHREGEHPSEPPVCRSLYRGRCCNVEFHFQRLLSVGLAALGKFPQDVVIFALLLVCNLFDAFLNPWNIDSARPRPPFVPLPLSGRLPWLERMAKKFSCLASRPPLFCP